MRTLYHVCADIANYTLAESMSSFSGVQIYGLIKLYVRFRIWIYFKSKEKMTPWLTVYALY